MLIPLFKKNIKIPVESIIVSVLFILQPFLSFPFLLFQILKRGNKIYYSLLSLLFGFFAYSMVPLGDLYRHYSYVYWIQDTVNSSAFFYDLISGFDYIIKLSLYVCFKLGITPQLISLLIVFVSFQVIFHLYSTSLKINTQLGKSWRLIFLLLLIFTQDFLISATKLRFPLGISFLILTIGYAMFFDKIKYKIFILSFLSHFSTLTFFPILHWYKKFSLSKIRILFIITIFIAPFTKLILQTSFSFIYELYSSPNDFMMKLNSYINGYWAENFFKDYSVNKVIHHYIKVILYFSILLYFLIIRSNNKRRKIIYLTFSFINLILSFPNLFNRFFTVGLVVGIIAIMLELMPKVSLIKRILVSVIFLLSSLNFMANLYAHNRWYSLSFLNDATYQSSFHILNNKYERTWIDAHIDQTGAIINYD